MLRGNTCRAAPRQVTHRPRGMRAPCPLHLFRSPSCGCSLPISTASMHACSSMCACMTHTPQTHSLLLSIGVGHLCSCAAAS